ncbi:adhesion G protein-coupled receptor B2 [Trichonephila clavipes]|nr:adhesion G protein-coupled receptor B2 [Trichonephila clavipes]
MERGTINRARLTGTSMFRAAELGSVSGTTVSGVMTVCTNIDNLVALHFKYDFWHRTATAGSDVVQSGRLIFDDFFQHLWPYIGNNTANVVFQMVKRLWLIRIDK